MQKEIENLKKENLRLKQEIENLMKKSQKQKAGMESKASKGSHMSRTPFGYKSDNKKLFPSEDEKIVEEIFLDFQNKDLSLNKLAGKYNFSVNGIKKILSNFTYLGKIKFGGQIHEGKHKPLISSTLFNHVQDKLVKIKK